MFTSGKAGTGKSTLIQYICATTDKSVAVVAPTGVAALNVQGATIHSFFRFPPRVILEEDVRKVWDSVYEKLDLLIVDEISMVRADMLDGIDRFLRLNGKDKRKPFGGVQVLMVGDLYQLPPVVGNAERALLSKYPSPFFFGADVVASHQLEHVELDKIYRQKDPEFTSLLNKLRVAEDVSKTLAAINKACLGRKHDADTFITLTATNEVAGAINEIGLKGIKEKEFLYVGVTSGSWTLKDQALPAPINLRLKVGAKVMFTKNDEEGRWVNGSLGIVTHLEKDAILVKVLDRDEEFRVDVVQWGTFRYEVDGKKVKPKNTGSYRQYPLMLAWAVTIHKAQGKTLGKIFVDMGTGAFAAGQVYVALSRVRSLDDIALAKAIQPYEVKRDDRIRQFYKGLEEAGLCKA